jgi:hypothetical protein
MKLDITKFESLNNQIFIFLEKKGISEIKENLCSKSKKYRIKEILKANYSQKNI